MLPAIIFGVLLFSAKQTDTLKANMRGAPYLSPSDQPEPEWWMLAYPAWLDPNAPPGVCVVCGKLAQVFHHLYSRQLRPETTPMCRVCEGAVHGRRDAKPGTMPRIMDLRRLLPPFAVRHEEEYQVSRVERRLIRDGTLAPAAERLGGSLA